MQFGWLTLAHSPSPEEDYIGITQQLTQACYADPLYGGNRGKVFWKLIGYPGLPAFHTQNMVTYRGKPFPGAADPKSIQDFS